MFSFQHLGGWFTTIYTQAQRDLSSVSDLSTPGNTQGTHTNIQTIKQNAFLISKWKGGRKELEMARWLRGHTVPHLVNTVDFSKNRWETEVFTAALKLPESFPFCFKIQARSFQIWLQSSKSFLKNKTSQWTKYNYTRETATSNMAC